MARITTATRGCALVDAQKSFKELREIRTDIEPLSAAICVSAMKHGPETTAGDH